MVDLKRLRDYAIEKHKDQKYGDKPYVYHLDMVHMVSVAQGLPQIVCEAAYLHDVLEDTPVTYDELKKEFDSEELAHLVFCVTDEKGNNRKERKAATYPKIKSNTNAIALKLCDRIANVKASLTSENSGLIKMYRKEQPEFEAQLKTVGVHTKLWEELDKLISGGIYGRE